MEGSNDFRVSLTFYLANAGSLWFQGCPGYCRPAGTEMELRPSAYTANAFFSWAITRVSTQRISIEALFTHHQMEELMLHLMEVGRWAACCEESQIKTHLGLLSKQMPHTQTHWHVFSENAMLQQFDKEVELISLYFSLSSVSDYNTKRNFSQLQPSTDVQRRSLRLQLGKLFIKLHLHTCGSRFLVNLHLL